MTSRQTVQVYQDDREAFKRHLPEKTAVNLLGDINLEQSDPVFQALKIRHMFISRVHKISGGKVS